MCARGDDVVVVLFFLYFLFFTLLCVPNTEFMAFPAEEIRENGGNAELIPINVTLILINA